MCAFVCVQVRPMAHMQVQIEREMRKKTSPLSETVRLLSTFKSDLVSRFLITNVEIPNLSWLTAR